VSVRFLLFYSVSGDGWPASNRFYGWGIGLFSWSGYELPSLIGIWGDRFCGVWPLSFISFSIILSMYRWVLLSSREVLFDYCRYVSDWRLVLWRLIVCLSLLGGGVSPDLRLERSAVVFMVVASVDLLDGHVGGRRASWTSSISMSRFV
jgi:hypothetical protein